MTDPSNRPDDLQSPKEERIAALSVAGTALAVLLTVVVLRMPRTSLVSWLEALANVGTFVLSLLGAVAAAWWWRHRGSALPRLKVTHSVDILPSTGSYIPLYVTAHLENVGEVPVTLTKWCLWASDMLPLPHEIDGLLNADPDRACRDFRLPWKVAAGAEFNVPTQDAPEVLPGETQDIGALLRVPANSGFVRIYSHLPHESLAGTRGWTNINIVRLKQEV
jgi:hypothetical protein